MESYFVCSLSDHPGELTCNGTIYYVHQNSQSDEVKPNQSLFWIYLLVYICLVLFAGMPIKLRDKYAEVFCSYLEASSIKFILPYRFNVWINNGSIIS